MTVASIGLASVNDRARAASRNPMSAILNFILGWRALRLMSGHHTG